MKMRFSDFLKDEAQYETDTGQLARFLILRADISYVVQDGFSYLRDKDIENNTFPIWSSEAITIYRWVLTHYPQHEALYHKLADVYRSIRGNSKWPDFRIPDKPKPGERVLVDFERLKRQSRKKFIRGNDKGRLEEVYYADEK